MRPDRTVLVLVYEFPPAGGAGVQRVLKFVKYLPEFTWQPVVVTATPETYAVLDHSLCADIPANTPVYRVASPDVNRLRPAFERRKLGKILSAANKALMLPDAAMFWARQARSAVRQAWQKHQPDALFSSSPVPSVQLLGLWAHRTFGVPWIADFRDPWSQNLLYGYYPGYRAVNRWMERQVLADADRVIAVSSTLVEMLRQLVAEAPQKVRVIENGYDDADVVVLPPPHTTRFTITYIGEFSRLRRPDVFVSAVDQLIASGQLPIADIRIAFVGKDTARYIPDRRPFEQLGYRSHTELDDIRRESDLLLLMQGDSPTAPAKTYEYLACNRPTLAITNPGNDAANLITQAHAGTAVGHDPAEIAAAVLDYYQRWKAGRFDYSADWRLLRHFSRRNLTRLLADQLDEVTTAA